MTPNQEVARLKQELIGMFSHMHKIRKELAAIGASGTEDDHFTTMSDLLDDIMTEVEKASDKIMGNMESTEDILEKIRGATQDQGIIDYLDQITENNNAVFEACAFQDLTGQRVSKVARSLKYVEERIKQLIYMWGRDELEALVTEFRLHENDAEEVDPDQKLLNGPQRTGVAITQDEIDKLFG